MREEGREEIPHPHVPDKDDVRGPPRDLTDTIFVDGQATVGFIQDITGRKQAEDDLKRSEERYSKLIATIPDSVVMTDLAGKITFVNQQMLTESGYSLDEMIGESLFRLINKEESPKAQNNAKRMTSGRLGSVEYNLVMKGGRQVLFEVNGDVLRDSEGRPNGFVFVCRDLTERKGMELKLRETNSKLKVMTSITRHDIKNQILALEGYLALMGEKGPGGIRDPCLVRAEAAAERISAMIEFTREYENIGVKAPVWQEVCSLVERCLKECRGGNIRYLNDVPKGVEVFADPMMVKVIQNLVQNAERHGGDVTHVRYSLDIVNGVGRLVCEDDGVGVSPDQRDTLFSKGTNREHGFGLFLSKEILGITGITVSEEGDPGHGAKFVMTIPTEGIRGSV